MTSEDWISQAEAARLRGVSRQAIARLITRGRLPAHQLAGRWVLRKSDVLAFEPDSPGRPPVHDVKAIIRLIEALDPNEQQRVLRRLRELLPHPMEAQLKASAETILEAISRASPLTLRGIEGILAEASFLMEVMPRYPNMVASDPPADAAYDFAVEDTSQGLMARIQVKMQRRKNHIPWMASDAMRSTRAWPDDFFVVEVQRTRGGTNRAGHATRPYRFDDFDILAVSLGAATGRWSNFIFTVGRWLLPEMTQPECILKYQPVPPSTNVDWTTDLAEAMGWFGSGRTKRIAG